MNKKILLIVLLVLALTMTFVACETHEHTFDTKWSSDATNHWHAATCDDTDEVRDNAPHNFKAVIEGNIEMCEVCGYSRNVIDNPNPNPEPQPKPHEHSFATELSFDESGHWYAATCEHTDEIKDFSKHEYVDGICKECGWWSSASDVLFANLSKSDIWSYAVILEDIDLSSISQAFADTAVDKGELKFNLTSQGDLSGYGYFLLKTDDDEPTYMKAVLKDGVIYAYGENLGLNAYDYFRCSLEDLAQQAEIDLSEVQTLLSALNANTQQVKEYVEEVKQYLQALPNDGQISELVKALVNIDEENSTEQLTVYVLNCDVLRQLNEMLATLTVADYVDGAFGEGFFADLPNYVESLFDMQVAKILLYIRVKLGYSLDDILTIVNSAIAELYPNEDVNTIDELLTTMGVDLRGLSVKQWIEAGSLFKLGTLLELAQEKSDNPITVADIVGMVDVFCKAYGDKTVYELAFANSEEINSDEFVALVDEVADKLESEVNLSFAIDADGILQEIFAYNGGMTFKRDYELKQDYSDVIEVVNENYCEHDYDYDNPTCIKLGNVCTDGVLTIVTCKSCNNDKIADISYEHNLTTKHINVYSQSLREHLIGATWCSDCNVYVDFFCDNMQIRELTDQDVSNDIIRSYQCALQHKCNARIDIVVVEDCGDYALTEINIYEDKLLISTLNSVYYYDSEAALPSNQHNHRYTQFRYVVQDEFTCVNGVEVFVSCEYCNNELKLADLHTHVLDLTRLEMPDGCCDGHFIFIYQCKACQLQTGMVVDEKFFYGYQCNNDKYPEFYSDVVCEDCGLTATWTIVEETDTYLICDVVVRLDDEVVYVGKNVTYLSSFTSLPSASE